MSVEKYLRRGGRVEVGLDSKGCGVLGLADADADVPKRAVVGVVVDVLVVEVVDGWSPGVTEAADFHCDLSFSFCNSPNVRGCEGDRKLS